MRPTNHLVIALLAAGTCAAQSCAPQARQVANGTASDGAAGGSPAGGSGGRGGEGGAGGTDVMAGAGGSPGRGGSGGSDGSGGSVGMADAAPLDVATGSGGAPQVDASMGSGGASGTGGSPGTGGAGGGPSSTNIIVAGLNKPDILMGDDTNLYWYDETDKKFFSIPKAGSVPPTVVADLAADALPGSLTTRFAILDGDSIYYAVEDATSGAVKKVPKKGGPPTVFAAAQKHVRCLAADATDIYWTASLDGTLMKQPKSGTTAQTLVKNEPGIQCLALTTDVAMFTVRADSATATSAGVKSVPLAGGAAKSLVTVPTDVDPVVVTATHIFAGVKSGAAQAGTLYAWPVVGGTTPATVATEETDITSLVRLGNDVYFVVRGSPTNMKPGFVKKVPAGKATAADVVILGSNLQRAWSPVPDGGAVYLIERPDETGGGSRIIIVR